MDRSGRRRARVNPSIFTTMLWEVWQQQRINSAEHSASRAENKANNMADDVRDLSRKVDHLMLASQAMWELLREMTSVTDEHLAAKILEIDARDGRVDGKIARQTCVCSACGRTTNSRRASCIMCGAPLKKDHIFEG